MEWTLVIIGMLVLIAAFGLTAAAACADMLGFLGRVEMLESEDDMDAFRRVVGHNMYAAVAMLGSGIAGGLLLTVAMVLGILGWLEMLLLLVLASVVAGAGGACTMMLEGRVKKIPVANESFHDERDRVVHVWKSKMFPDW